jgi:endonuclease/exonuclease/phosphatase (EEP) superfamily protein YafD
MPPGFRLLTVNLLHERSNAGSFEDLVVRTRPDVVVTQELGPGAAGMLAARYPHHHFIASVDLTGRGIFTTFQAEFGDIDMPRRKGTSAIIDLGPRRVWLAGVHFLNPVNFPWWAAARSRRRQLDSLLEWMEPISGPLVVAGDFNASPAWPTYKEMSTRLRDLVADHGVSSGSPAERTWGWRPGWPRLLRIDHVFGRGLLATKVTVEPVAGSDHFAVIADLELTDD